MQLVNEVEISSEYAPLDKALNPYLTYGCSSGPSCYGGSGRKTLSEKVYLRDCPHGYAINGANAGTHFDLAHSADVNGCWCYGYSEHLQQHGWVGCHVLK
jgi:hypothetical protein